MDDDQADIVKRLEELESWKKNLIYRVGLAAFVLTLAAAIFGISLSSIKDNIDLVQEDVEGLTNEVSNLHDHASEAAAVADDALLKAGTLEEAVARSQAASDAAETSSRKAKSALDDIRTSLEVATDSSQKAEEYSKKALAGVEQGRVLMEQIQIAVQEAHQSSQTAQAVVKVVEDNSRELDLAIVGARHDIDEALKVINTKSKSAGRSQSSTTQSRSQAAPKVINVHVSSTGAKVTLKSGQTSLRTIKIREIGYKGTVYIPSGYSAVVHVTGTGNRIYVSKPLRGWVSMQSSGTGNKLIESMF